MPKHNTTRAQSTLTVKSVSTVLIATTWTKRINSSPRAQAHSSNAMHVATVVFITNNTSLSTQ